MSNIIIRVAERKYWEGRTLAYHSGTGFVNPIHTLANIARQRGFGQFVDEIDSDVDWVLVQARWAWDAGTLALIERLQYRGEQIVEEPEFTTIARPLDIMHLKNYPDGVENYVFNTSDRILSMWDLNGVEIYGHSDLIPDTYGAY